MKIYSLHIIRLGMAITFLWIGILILQDPEVWGLYLQPWALDLLPISLKEAMIGVAVLDISIGILLFMNIWTWIVALVGALHIASVLIVSGINAITVRDIGLLAAMVALAMSTLPHDIRLWNKKRV